MVATLLPAVSVIIPCYNLGAYLDEAVESVLAQTCQDFEIIVINDGSTDDWTNQLLASYDRPRTRVYTTPNRGLSAARNLGIEAARGRYFCALDADDKLDPTYFEKALRTFEQDPGLAFVSSWLQMFGAENTVWRQDRCDLETVLRECTISTAAVTSRAVLEAVGGYDAAMREGYEDWDLWIRVLRAGYRGTILPEVLFWYRRRAGSMSTESCRGETHLKLMRYLYDKHGPAYRAHLHPILMGQEAEIGRRLRHLRELEHRISVWAVPLAKHRRAMVASLAAKERAIEHERQQLEENTRRLAALEQALVAARTETSAMASRLAAAVTDLELTRGSTSWRVTAPLRAVSIAVRGLARSAHGSAHQPAVRPLESGRNPS